MATFYLKYRPQTIEELDLDNVRLQLSKVLQSDNIPHAFLFSGARGLGKTSAARILAKSINCETKNKKAKTSKKKPTTSNIEPCNKCEACISITKGMAIDVIEIDGASNRGIDDIRALRETIASAPLNLTKKIYVIDEVHMLTKEAFNALLKTLEEPPSHVVFILATTEPQKLPETIISRTFHIQFQKATPTELKRSLQRVITGEQLQIDDKVIDQIINRADGGFRDSVKMLEQLAFVSDQIDENTFAIVFPQNDVEEFLQMLAQKKAKQAFSWIKDQDQQGGDWENITRNILISLKEKLLAFYGVSSSQKTSLNEPEIKQLITLFLNAGWQLKTSLVPALPLEIIVAQWCGEGQESTSKDQAVSSEEKKKKPQILGNKLQTEKKEPEAIKKEVKSPEVAKPDIKAKDDKSNTVDLNLTMAELVKKWEQLLLTIRPQNHSVEALLRSAQPYEVNDKEVVIKVYYEFHKGRLETEKCLQIMQKAFEKVHTVKPRIRYVLGQKQEKQQLDEQKDENLAKIAEEIFN